jgi:hypothetical protein
MILDGMKAFGWIISVEKIDIIERPLCSTAELDGLGRIRLEDFRGDSCFYDGECFELRESGREA